MRGSGLRLDLVGPDIELKECHPYGVYVVRGHDDPRVGVRVGDSVVDIAAAADRDGFARLDLLSQPTLDALLAAGRRWWNEVEAKISRWIVSGPRHRIADVIMQLPFTVADYVDFYASEHHATNLGGILRPGQPPLPANWKHQPIGYHGRAGTVVVSGTPVVRPRGHVMTAEGDVALRPTEKLDVEVEVGFVVGTPSTRGEPVPVTALADHVFGVVLVNDWSARDIQGWETVPLGPFLGKSFQTSISAWVVPLSALGAARVPAASSRKAEAEPTLSAYLEEPEPWGLDLALELRVNGELVSRPPYSTMHWSPAQMLAHLTVNGASLRTGDLYASGTVSGMSPDEVGSLIERWGGERFLADGDEVIISATAPAADGGRISLGDVRGVVEPARQAP